MTFSVALTVISFISLIVVTFESASAAKKSASLETFLSTEPLNTPPVMVPLPETVLLKTPPVMVPLLMTSPLNVPLLMVLPGATVTLPLNTVPPEPVMVQG